MSETRRHQRRDRKRRRLRITLIAIGSVLALLIGTAAVYVAHIANTFDSTESIEKAFPEESTRPEVTVGDAAKSQNILLLGSDTRGSLESIDNASGQLSDTMMVAHISGDRKSIQIMSLMRDSWVEIPGKGTRKINAALSLGGVPLAVQTVESLIGVRIDHVAIVDFAGFEGMTNALGGVSLTNPIAFDSSHMKGRRFEQGPLSLNGKEALAFVRERYAFSDGDYQRVRNQQAFIKALVGKVLTAETLTNPVTISNLVGAVAPFMKVDKDFTSTYAASLGFELRDVRSDNMTFFTMPTLGTAMVGSQAIVRVNFDELENVKKHFREDTLLGYVPPKR